MPSTSTSKVTPIVLLLRQEHAKIEDMVSRLLESLAAVRIVEYSVETMSSAESVDRMSGVLADAQAVLQDIARRLDRMGSRLQ